MFKLQITPRILEALADTPVVFLRGARRSGKSTLVRTIAEEAYPARYVSLDNAPSFRLQAPIPRVFLPVSKSRSSSMKPSGFRRFFWPSRIQDLAAVPRLLPLLVRRTFTLHNQSEISRGSGIPNSTQSRYMALLKMTFLVHELPAWAANLGKRLVKVPEDSFSGDKVF